MSEFVEAHLDAPLKEQNLSRQHELCVALADIMSETEPYQYGPTINVSNDVATLRRIREIARRALAHEPPICSHQNATKR